MIMPYYPSSVEHVRKFRLADGDGLFHQVELNQHKVTILSQTDILEDLMSI